MLYPSLSGFGSDRTRARGPVRWPVFLVLLVAGAAGCGGDDGLGAPVAFSAVEAALNEAIGLSAIVRFETDRPGHGLVRVVSEDGEVFVVDGGSLADTADAGPGGWDHEVRVQGLRPRTRYRFLPVLDAGGSRLESAMAAELTTEPLPLTLAALETAGDPSRMQPGLTLFSLAYANIAPLVGVTSLSDPRLVMVDETGRVVWFTRAEFASRPQGFAILSNGNIAAIGGDALEEMRLDGVVVRRIDYADAGLSLWHHDAILLPDGGLLGLSLETRPTAAHDGTVFAGVVDVVFDIGPDGTIRHRWPVDRCAWPPFVDAAPAVGTWDAIFPGQGATLDLFHANSLDYDAATDIVTVGLFRTGEVVRLRLGDGVCGATLGADREVALDGGSWFESTHGANFTPAGTLLSYDNRNRAAMLPTSTARVLEYAVVRQDGEIVRVDEIWSYETGVRAPFAGSAYRLDNGNTLVTNGSGMSTQVSLGLSPSIVEVTGDATAEVVFSLSAPATPPGYPTPQPFFYRAYRVPSLYPWVTEGDPVTEDSEPLGL